MKKCLSLLILLCIFFTLSLEAKEKKSKYRYQLAAALMFQNEAEHLKEWIEYHKVVGFDHFYLFNNLSTDNFMDVIKPYLASGEVELFQYPQISTNQQEYLAIQCAIYKHALSLARGNAKWLALIDADEYVMPLRKKSVLDVLKQFEYAGGIYLNWLMFGTSNVEKIPADKLLIETLTYCQSHAVNLGKSIVRPERVSDCSDPHRMWYHPPFYHVNTNGEKFDWICPIADTKMILFHYFTGDKDHLINVKFPRRRQWVAIETAESYVQGLEHLNEVQNFEMERFIPKVKKGMQRSE